MKHAELNKQIKMAFLEIERMRLREYSEIFEQCSGIDINYSDCYKKHINKLFENDQSDCDRDRTCNLDNFSKKTSFVRLYVKRAVCVAAAIVIASGAVIIIDDNVRTAVVNAAQRVFSFIPGTGSFIENSGGIIAMQGSVRAEFDDGYIKVNSAYIASGHMEITLEGTVTFKDSDEISICDDEKKSAEYPDETNLMNDENGRWSAACTFTIENVKYNKNAIYFININGNNIPIVLAPVKKITKNVNYYEDEDIGVSAAVITEYTKDGTDKLKLSLSAKSNIPNTQINFGNDSIKLIKSDNTMVMPESCMFSENGKCTAVFDTLLDEDTKLIVSNVKLYETLSGSYDLKFEVKRDSLFNRTFDINGKKINISGAEWQSYYNNMNMRLPDGDKADAGSSAQKIMLNADIQGKLADKLKLTGLELKPNSDYINNYEYNGKKLIYENADKTANEENASDNGADITACIENIKPHIASALIEISGISYELKDDIIIKLAV